MLQTNTNPVKAIFDATQGIQAQRLHEQRQLFRLICGKNRRVQRGQRSQNLPAIQRLKLLLLAGHREIIEKKLGWNRAFIKGSEVFLRNIEQMRQIAVARIPRILDGSSYRHAFAHYTAKENRTGIALIDPSAPWHTAKSLHLLQKSAIL